ncbi:T9SS C-terminal target domain-containing protein [Crocinitomix catalasitica]|uniref:T9SS C-terminal target domain-containing protein n=1 Tax=Crocinitomix catalasitica TaxID=184607 RepID=UPI000487DB56|nr:T9SS C-terminal target domain-containing protein [Crocinitomix catalasitica]
MKFLIQIFCILFISTQVSWAQSPIKNPKGLAYISNQGQWNNKVLFKTGFGNGALFLEKDGITFTQMHNDDLEAFHHSKHDGNADVESFNFRGHAWNMKFIGNTPITITEGVNKLPGYHNYFIGQDKSKWASHVPLFDQVNYLGLYNGIDLMVYSNGSNLKYDFIVQPNIDPSSIKMLYNGDDGIRLEDGNIKIRTSIGEFTEFAPYAYQIIDGKEIQVECHFQLNESVISFILPAGYDKTKELVIDPELVGATLSGSTGTNYGHCATFDKNEDMYTGAINFGSGYPATVGAFQTSNGGGSTDIAISKISGDGTTLIYATHLGGAGSEYPHSMVVNDNNELYVFGSSNSIDFPVSDDAYGSDGPTGADVDIIVTHLNNDGSDIIGSTYIGGANIDGRNPLTGHYGDDYRGEIIIDDLGNCYVTSCSNSADFPVTGGAYQSTFGGSVDAVVFSLNPDLSNLLWSTYLGGTMQDVGLGLRLDNDGDVYVSGGTQNEFIAATGYQSTYQGGGSDAFVLKLIADGTAVEYSSYWGTDNIDFAYFVDIDVNGSIYIYGLSKGGTSPVTDGVYSNDDSHQFIARLDPTLASLELATVIGAGGANFIPIAFMVDDCGYIYFSGHSARGALPLTDDHLYDTGGFYLGVLEPDATDLTFSTLYTADHVDGGTSRFDPSTGIVYQAVCVIGLFTTTPGAHATTAPGWDVGIFKIDFGIAHVKADAEASPSTNGCAPFTVDFMNESAGVSYQWNFDDGSPTEDTFEPTHTFVDPGTYEVQLISYDPEGCLTSDTTYITIVVGAAIDPTANFIYEIDCATQTVTVSSTGTGGVPYFWDMGDGNTYTDSTFSHVYTGAGVYTITLNAGDDLCGSIATTTEDIVIGEAPIDVIFNRPTCFGFSDGSVTIDIIGGGEDATIIITDEEGIRKSLEGTNTANSLTSGIYYYTVSLGDGCESSGFVELLDPPQINAQLTLTHPKCYGDETGTVVVDPVLNAQGDYDRISYTWNPNPAGIGGLFADSSFNMGAGVYIVQITDENGCSRDIDFRITQPDSIRMVEFTTEPAYCRLYNYQRGNGVVKGAAAGGTPDFTYEWENLGNLETTNNSTWGGRNPGTYQLTVTDANGCQLIRSIVLDSLNPRAAFTPTSLEFTTDYEGTAPVTVHFTNESSNFANPNNPLADTTFLWNFNHDFNPWIISHSLGQTYDTTYADGGIYEVCLIAMNKNGCQDTLCKNIVVYDPMVFENVNVFTPNGDGSNDEFTFVYRSDAVKNFYCVVIDRWGITIAEFDDITDTWDGKTKKGKPCTDGVYFYKYEGEADNGEKFSGQSTVTIISQE